MANRSCGAYEGQRVSHRYCKRIKSNARACVRIARALRLKLKSRSFIPHSRDLWAEPPTHRLRKGDGAHDLAIRPSYLAVRTVKAARRSRGVLRSRFLRLLGTSVVLSIAQVLAACFKRFRQSAASTSACLTRRWWSSASSPGLTALLAVPNSSQASAAVAVELTLWVASDQSQASACMRRPRGASDCALSEPKSTSAP